MFLRTVFYLVEKLILMKGVHLKKVLLCNSGYVADLETWLRFVLT